MPGLALPRAGFCRSKPSASGKGNWKAPLTEELSPPRFFVAADAPGQSSADRSVDCCSGAGGKNDDPNGVLGVKGTDIGLASEPQVDEGAADAAERSGTGTGFGCRAPSIVGGEYGAVCGSANLG